MASRNAGTVIVTGGTRGIGAAIARAFYETGYRVVCAARADNGFARRLGPRASFVSVDVRREADHVAAIDFALVRTGRFDVYVNCAGLSGWRPIGRVDEEFWDTIIDTNLLGTLWGAKAAAARLPRGGGIINMSSLAGKRGSAHNAVYCAAKFGVNGLTQALAKELGPRGVRVNAVCPVYVVTPGLRRALADPSAPSGGRAVAAYLRRFAREQAALRRLPRAEEVGRLCVFLASPAASAITGQCINVDCGVLPQ